MGLTEIEIFRFIEFRFVSESEAWREMEHPQVRANLTIQSHPRRDGIMALGLLFEKRRVFVLMVLLSALASTSANAQTKNESSGPASPDCRVEAVNYRGWNAQRLSNQWVQATLVPQNGGRLMQVSFAGHSYLFVNPKYAGKYLPPDPSRWFNYGGDKLWLLPEGNNDEQHWAGGSDILDDGPYSFRTLSQGQHCEVELTGPADAQTGVQFRRTIRLDADSARIRFHASMKNVSGHAIEWSMQSVSQYDTGDAGDPSRLNNNFWTFTPANRSSSYLNRYHVRFGPAENAAVSVRDDGLFALQYVHLAAELWLDSSEGWLAVIDGSTGYAMVERFRYENDKSYPGKASVIFWTNGPEVKVNANGRAVLSGGEEGEPPYYLEAEINSPLCRLNPGETCALETEWFPTRAGSELRGVTDAGIIMRPLRATVQQNGKIRLSGGFGVFFAGSLVAHFYNEHGSSLGTMHVTNVTPTELASLEMDITPPGKSTRVSLHLEDRKGLDVGPLQEVQVGAAENAR